VPRKCTKNNTTGKITDKQSETQLITQDNLRLKNNHVNNISLEKDMTDKLGGSKSLLI